jgi:ubiquinone/menaquinone biosynthesis C-methylase UbiE
MSLVEKAPLMMQPSKSQYDFDKIADSYDGWYDSAKGKKYDRLEKQAIDRMLAGIAKGSRLLEVGCGTGHWSRYFSGKGFEVTGIDLSEKMIDVARQKNIPNCHFEVADGRNLPFKDRSFDAAVAITVLEFASDPKKIITEMVRCVKNNKGVIIIGVLNALNPYNQKRKNQPGSVYSFAHLFLPQHLRALLSPYGVTKMRIAAFVPEKDWLLAISPLWEYVGRFLFPPKGALIVSRVILWTCRPK